MTATLFHGVQVRPLTENPFISGGNVTIGLIGTVFKGAEMKLISTLEEAVSYYGNQAGNSTLISALSTILKYGAGRLICSPIAVATPGTTTVAAKEYQIPLNGKLELPHKYVTSVTVTNLATPAVPYVLTTDYLVDNNNGKITRVASGMIPQGATISVGYSIPEYVPTSISINAASTRLEEAEGLLGYRPNIILAPGHDNLTGTPNTYDNLVSVAGKLFARALLDSPASLSTAGVLSARDERTGLLGLSNPRAIVCHPKVKNSAGKTEYLSCHLAGIIAKTDRDFGYWRSPDNQPLIGVVGVDATQALSMSDRDSTAQNQQLNFNGIYSVVSLTGKGLYGWGQYNTSFPDNSSIQKYIPVQQIEDIITVKLADAARPFIGAERSGNTAGAIGERLLLVLNSEESLLPGSEVRFLPTESTPTILHFSIKVFPKLPIEGVYILLSQSVAL